MCGKAAVFLERQPSLKTITSHSLNPLNVHMLVHMTCRSGSWAALCYVACGYPRVPGKEAPEGIRFNSPQTTILVCT